MGMPHCERGYSPGGLCTSLTQPFKHTLDKKKDHVRRLNPPCACGKWGTYPAHQSCETYSPVAGINLFFLLTEGAHGNPV